MDIGNFELFTAKAEEARTEREYLEAVRDTGLLERSDCVTVSVGRQF